MLKPWFSTNASLGEVSKGPGSGVFGLAGWQWPAGRLLAARKHPEMNLSFMLDIAELVRHVV